MAILLASNINGTVNVTGQVTAANGTITVPSYSFGAQTNAGMYLITTNAIGVTSNGNIVLNISQSAVTINTTAFKLNGSANIAGTLNVTANIANVGNLLITQNTFTGNLSVTTNVTCANLTVNAVSFIPVWTAITCNVTLAPNSFSGVSTNNDTAGFWTDPFGIVHLRGLICANTSQGVNVANTLGNIAIANIVSFARNIANGFPAPTSQTVFEGSVSFQNGTPAGNVVSGRFVLMTNGALQCYNVDPANFSTTLNIANISLYGFTYSTH